MAAQTGAKQRGKPWQPGQSGNPRGRPRGSLNKASVARIVEQAGQTPLEFLLAQMRNPENALPVRLEAAKAAAPYCHARLQAMTIIDPPRDEVVEVTLVADGMRTIVRDGVVVGVERDQESPRLREVKAEPRCTFPVLK